MSREFKPGDVALRSYLGNSFTSMYVPACAVRDHDSGPHWHHADGGWDRRDGSSTYRPLVVIDPEDREQIKRLIRSMDVEFEGFPRETVTDSDCANMRAALRSLIAPPKPEEPQGLGAVVEDAEGVRWTRVEAGGSLTRNPWYPAGDEDKQPADYAEIDAVLKLAEGIS